MKALSHLFYKVTLSSMIITAPAMTTGSNTDLNYGSTTEKESAFSNTSSSVIKRFVHYNRAIFANTGLKAGSAEEKAIARKAELAMVINQAVVLYDEMNLQKTGLSEQAFEYAWRGYHNLVKRGALCKTNVLSICDFSQSSYKRRLYVIDIRHRKLLYRTYVAHGQNSGSEYASSFSNRPDSWKSSLGFYVTTRTYFGHNGLSLKIEGLDTGFNDLAGKRNIVVHGCSYVGVRYKTHYGNEGTSLGCPAVPNYMSGKIIRAVKNGSCFFIYHNTQKYLDQSPVLNSDI